MISIHQSQFISWCPLFYKILRSDVFVVLDDVQFQKNGVQNRNIIKTPHGEQWITLPVKGNLGTLIKDSEVSNLRIYKKIIKTLEVNYKKAPYFHKVFPVLQMVLEEASASLHETNMKLFQEILNFFDLKPKIIQSSSLDTVTKKNNLVIEIINKLEDKTYITGVGALNYMDLEKFKNAGITVLISHFNYNEYSQLWPKGNGFIPNLSIVDLLFNNLEGAEEYLLLNGNLQSVG